MTLLVNAFLVAFWLCFFAAAIAYWRRSYHTPPDDGPHMVRHIRRNYPLEDDGP
jgi:hypothetical protein